MTRHLPLATSLALLAGGFADAQQAGAPGKLDPRIDLDREHHATHILYELVEPARGAVGETRQSLRNMVRAVADRDLWPGRIFMLDLPEGADLGQALALLNADARVRYAQPDGILRADTVPNDPSFPQQWGLHQASDADIDAPEAWTSYTDGQRNNTIIAVIDTGVDYTHPELVNSIWTNWAEIPNNGIDDDGNGYVDDRNGWDFCNLDNDPMDDNGHGTHCSGIIGAEGNNNLGVVGVNWKACIMPLKFLGANGVGWMSDSILALNYAVANGARLSSNSYAAGYWDFALETAITLAGDSCHLFVCAAGNNTLNVDTNSVSPASYNLPNQITVAATDSLDLLAGFSNFGLKSVHLGAPGVSILSTLTGNTYGYLSGTSMACPMVAGVANMLFANSNSIDPLQVKQWILSSVDAKASLLGKTATGGRLNFYKAVKKIPGLFSLAPGLAVVSLREDGWTDSKGQSCDKGDLIVGNPKTLYNELFFDLQDILKGSTANIDAVAVTPDTRLLISFDEDVDIPCLIGGPEGTLVRDEDIVMFKPVTYYQDTSGHFEFFFDGSDLGLDSPGEDIDAIAWKEPPFPYLLFSTEGPSNLLGPGVMKDEDIVIFSPLNLGKDTAGFSFMFFDGSSSPDIKLGAPSEDVDALDFYAPTLTLYLSTEGNFSVPGPFTGQDDDVLVFNWTSATSGTYSKPFDGAVAGLNFFDIDALEVIDY